MGVTSLVKELEMGLQESQNQRDKRVEDLWKRLDVQQTGYLDFKGLQRGLRRIDHRMSCRVSGTVFAGENTDMGGCSPEKCRRDAATHDVEA
jgi:hypothetical protein